RSRLGLAEQDFEYLAAKVDAIYHAAARVSAVDSFARLRRANVGGTQEILRLAAACRTKPVHHISTAAVVLEHGLEDSAGRTGFREHERAAPEAVLAGGYVAGKWLAEEYVWQA